MRSALDQSHVKAASGSYPPSSSSSSSSPAGDSPSTPVVTCCSQWCSTQQRCQSVPATVQPDGTTCVCQASAGRPSTIFSTASRWYCRKPRSMRDSSSWFTSLGAGDAASGVVTGSAIVPVLPVGPSCLTTAGATETYRGYACAAQGRPGPAGRG